MKTLSKILMATILTATAVPAMADSSYESAEAEAYAEIDLDLVERASGLLATRSREALEFLKTELDSRKDRTNHGKAVRAARALNLLALEMLSLAETGAPNYKLEETLEEIEFQFLQIDATKRALARKYRSDRRDINKKFNAIRSSYMALKLELTGKL
ncbi:MAG: hypothetical protein HRU19_24340 [Pseudobacteriovorax sp.]|nr:hypothetical protein [Pseudobacteriovorax sp.]